MNQLQAVTRHDVVRALTEIMLDDSWAGLAPTRKKVYDLLSQFNDEHDFRIDLMGAGEQKVLTMFGATLISKTLFPELFTEKETLTDEEIKRQIKILKKQLSNK